MEQEQTPEQNVTVTIMLNEHNGLRLVTFTNKDTLVRRFTDKPEMSYIFQHGNDAEAPLIVFGFDDMADYLVSVGITEVLGSVPTEPEVLLYEHYQSRRLEHELGQLGLSEGEGL